MRRVQHVGREVDTRSPIMKLAYTDMSSDCAITNTNLFIFSLSLITHYLLQTNDYS